MVFLYMSNEHVDTEIKNTIPFIIQKKKMKYSGVNLANQA